MGGWCRRGDVRNALDEPGGMDIPAEVLEAAVVKGQFDNLACFIDHAGIFDGPSLKNLFGTWSDIAYNPETQSIDGTLTVFETDQNNQIADIFAAITSNEPSIDVGVSIVFYGDWEEANKKRTLKRFIKVESADLVFMPAADGRILEALSALNTHGGKEMSED